MVIRLAFFFFFSSRRRHTRWPRDWSSDVCSSDLDRLASRGIAKTLTLSKRGTAPIAPVFGLSQLVSYSRSEERRVGKECRSWWGRQHEKKKRRCRNFTRTVRLECKSEMVESRYKC